MSMVTKGDKRMITGTQSTRTGQERGKEGERQIGIKIEIQIAMKMNIDKKIGTEIGMWIEIEIENGRRGAKDMTDMRGRETKKKRGIETIRKGKKAKVEVEVGKFTRGAATGNRNQNRKSTKVEEEIRVHRVLGYNPPNRHRDLS